MFLIIGPDLSPLAFQVQSDVPECTGAFHPVPRMVQDPSLHPKYDFIWWLRQVYIWFLTVALLLASLTKQTVVGKS